MPELDLTSPEAKEAIQKAVDALRAKEKIDVSALTGKNTDLLGEIKNLKTKLKGFDPERFAELEKIAKEVEEKKHKADIKDNNVEALVKKHEKQLADTINEKNIAVKEATDKVLQLQTSYSQSITDRTIVEALAKREVSPEAMKNNLKEHLRTVQDEQGNFRTIVVDIVTGDERIDPKTNERVTVDSLLDDFALNPAFAPLFPQSSGSGSKEKKGGLPVSHGVKYSDLKTLEDQVEFQRKYGKEAMEKVILENK